MMADLFVIVNLYVQYVLLTVSLNYSHKPQNRKNCRHQCMNIVSLYKVAAQVGEARPTVCCKLTRTAYNK